MVLQSQPVDVLFTGALDDKTAEALVPSGNLLKAENVRRQKSGEISKRYGFSQIGADTTFTTPNTVKSYGNELVAIADNSLYTYDSANDTWRSKDSTTITTTDYRRIFSNPIANQDRPTMAVYNNLALYSWVDTNVIRYSIRDISSGADLVSNASSGLSCTSGETYRVEVLGSKFYLFAGGASNNLSYLSIDTTTFTKSAVTTLVSDFNNTVTIFSTVVFNNTLYLAYRETGGNIRTRVYNTALSLLNVQDISDTPADALAIYAWISGVEGKSLVSIAWNDSSNNVKAMIYTDNLIVHRATLTLDTSQTNVKKIVVGHDPDNDDSAVVFWDRYDSSKPANTYTRVCYFSDAGVVQVGQFLRSVDLFSEFFVYNGVGFLAVKHESELQSTIFVATLGGTIVATFAQSIAAPIETTPFLSQIRALSNSKWSFAMDVRGRLISEDNTLFTFSDVASGDIELAQEDVFASAQANNLLYFAGGVLQHYDGKYITESGFHLYPEGISEDATATSGGSMSDGTYQYVAVYTWYDNQGNRHQSAPSEALSVTLSGATTNQTVTIGVPTLRLTRKQSTRGKVIVDLYRTEDAGSIFYKVTSLTDITENSTTTDTVQIVDTASDASLISNEILYTEGNVLDNIAPPACKRLAVYDNRLFLLGLHELGEVRFSKTIAAGEGIAFNETLSTYIPEAKSEVTAGTPVDTNLLLFLKNQVYVLSGVGPSNTGEGSTFNTPELLPADVGAVDSRSLVLGPEGVYFKSNKGIYLLSRGLDTQYVGAPVESYNGLAVTSAVLVPTTHEIRFTLADKTILVHNYLFQNWFVTTGHQCQSSVVWNNTHILMRTDGKILQESTSFRDLEAFYRLKVQTGWLKLSNLAGFQRVRRAIFYGDYKSDHKLTIKVYTDYSDTVRQTVVFDPTTVLDQLNLFGDDTPFGNESPFGGSVDNDMYEFEVHIAPQKCQAIRFEIEEHIDPRTDPQNSGRAMNLVGFTMDVGVRKGLNKLRNGRKG